MAPPRNEIKHRNPIPVSILKIQKCTRNRVPLNVHCRSNKTRRVELNFPSTLTDSNLQIHRKNWTINETNRVRGRR